ncbi:hypothetical protein AAGS61_10625 [Lysinibacillus sp. KU-BSD001]|uniref:hypothetical protein n=1 Tax=Lysinibacillus sp. KU-BSD001 TaxID=3141328 RepID=UPI0036EB7B2E
MQNEKLINQTKNVITTKEMTLKLKLPKPFEALIIALCENNFIQAQYINDEWLVFENQKLPCLKLLAVDDYTSAMNQDDLNILNESYEIESSRELAYWPYTLYNDDEIVGFEHIIIAKDVHKNPDGNLHSKYVLYIETFPTVAKWNDPLEKVLKAVEEINIYPSDVYPCAVFDTEFEAFQYAELVYPEYPLVNVIVLEHVLINGFSED